MHITLIVALGNPGKAYERTYHNAGILFADYIEHHAPTHPALSKITIARSKKFMNQSGAFVREMLKQKQIPPDEMLIAHDDSDLPLGTWKLVFERGSGGHRGVTSIIDALHTNAFWRLRIGIRPPEPALQKEAKTLPTRIKAGDFVLKKIPAKNLTLMKKGFAEATEALLQTITSLKSPKQ